MGSIGAAEMEFVTVTPASAIRAAVRLGIAEYTAPSDHVAVDVRRVATDERHFALLKMVELLWHSDFDVGVPAVYARWLDMYRNTILSKQPNIYWKHGNTIDDGSPGGGAAVVRRPVTHPTQVR